MADEQIIVGIQVDTKDVDNAVKDFDKLNKSIEELSNRISDARKQNKEYKKTQEDLNKEYLDGKISVEKYEKEIDKLNSKISVNNAIIADSAVELQKQKRERNANIKIIDKEGQTYVALSNKLNLARNKAKDLAVQFGANSKAFKRAQRDVVALDKKLKAIDNSLGQNQRSVGKYTDALKGLGGEMLGAMGVTAGISAVVSGFQAFNEKAKILIGVTNQVKQTFGVTREEARKLSNDIVALASNFDEDYKSILISANAVSKEFGITAEESLKLIEEGFKKGSNNSGEFLDILKEYPTQLKSIGLNAEQSFAIINQQVTSGVYSDKGIDSLKEGGLRLRENTKAAKEALSVFSKSTQEQIKQSVESGKTFEAMQLISKEMKTAGLNAQETQTIIADVFGGAGEDALSFVMNLDQVNLSLSGVANQTSIVEDASLELDKQWNNFVSSVDNGTGIISTATAFIKNSVAGLLEGITDLNDGTATWLESLQRTGALGSALKIQADATIEARKVAKKAAKENIDEIDLVAKKREEDLKKYKEQQIENAKITRQAAKDREKILQESEKKRAEQIETRAQEKIQKEIERSEKEIAIANKTANEKKLIELTSFAEISKIRKEADEELLNSFAERQEAQRLTAEQAQMIAESERAWRVEQIESVRESTNELNAIASEFAGSLGASFGVLANNIFDAFEDGKISLENSLEIIGAATNLVFNAVQEKQQTQLTNLEAQKQSELELNEGNEEATLAIEEKYAKESAKIKLKQFKLDKANALTQIGIQTALAVTKALPNIPLSIVVGGIGLVQAGIVATKQPTAFGAGTDNIVSIGDSHASGNDVTVFGQTSSGETQVFGRVERGEAMPVIRKSAVNDYLVSSLNNRTFANGTNDITANETQSGISVNDLQNVISNMPQPVVLIEDVTAKINDKADVKSNSQF